MRLHLNPEDFSWASGLFIVFHAVCSLSLSLSDVVGHTYLCFSFSLSGLGRNIILTTMPAGTKLIAGNKPVSFLTAQQLQQLQQQGQATQVRSNADC